MQETEILHARLHHYVKQEIPDIEAGFRKGTGTSDQIAKIRWIIKKKTKRISGKHLSLFHRLH